MTKNPGRVLTDAEGNLFLAYNSEQKKEFIAARKIYLHYVDVNFKPILKDGKNKVGLRNASLLTVTGYFD